MSTKIHHLTDANGLPLVVLVGAGQAGDSPMLPILLSHLRSRRIEAVISEPRDQQGHRRNRGSCGGRPPKFDAQKYKGRHVIERSFSAVEQWRGLATRYDKLALTYRAGALLHAVFLWSRHITL